MSVFIAISALITLVAVAWVVYPLLRPAPHAGVSSQRLNAAIYRDQLETLARDLDRGAISPEDHEATRDELQLRLLDDTQEPPSVRSASQRSFWSARRTSAVIAVVLPLASLGMYGWLGNPAAMTPVAGRQVSDEQVAQMVDTLAARMKANPDNPKGWAMLARSYKVMGRFEEAEQAFVKAGDFINADPDLLVEYAELLAQRADNNLEGRPLALIKQALLLDPKHPSGLMMSGVAAYQRADYALASAQWKNLLDMLEPGSPDALQIQANLEAAREKMGLLPPVDEGLAGPMTAEKINQMVERLAQRLKSNPDDRAGWAQLARAYRVQGRVAEAEVADARAKGQVESPGVTGKP